jgi:CheY-like chemotaxis protein
MKEQKRMENRVMLLAEDNEDEVFLIKRSLNKSSLPVTMQVVANGEETMAYLRAEGKFADRGQFPFPNFLLLDISMPRMNGLEVLEAIRNDPALTRLTVVFFTCSEHEDDISRASDLHANSYLLKPADLTNLDDLMHLL